MLYRTVLKPLLFLQDPERVHDRFVYLGAKISGIAPLRRLIGTVYRYEHPSLIQDVCGITFHNPIGLAAGFDKDCRLMRILPEVGFGFEEVGSITAQPYGGNQGTRLVRLPADESILVNYGLKNEGSLVLRQRLKGTFEIPIGVSVAKTNRKFANDEEKLDDWMLGIKRLKDSGDYLTINVSCPNTHDPNNYCDPLLLERLLARIEKEGIAFTRPVFLKITADLRIADVDRIISVCDDAGFISGFVISNLVKDRASIRLKSPKERHEAYRGGLSGKVVMPKALELVKHFHRQAGARYVLIGCGGISCAEDAWEYIRNGCSLVQLITGMIYHGPGVVKEINKGLVEILAEQGFAHIADAVGCAYKG